MTFFRLNYFHLFCLFFLIFVKYMLMYLTFSNLNSIHWIIKKDIGLYVLFRRFSGHFMTIFRSNYFHLKKMFLFFFTYSLNICNFFFNFIFTYSLNICISIYLTNMLEKNKKNFFRCN